MDIVELGERMTKLEEAIQSLQVALYDYNRDRTESKAFNVFYWAKKLYSLTPKAKSYEHD